MQQLCSVCACWCQSSLRHRLFTTARRSKWAVQQSSITQSPCNFLIQPLARNIWRVCRRAWLSSIVHPKCTGMLTWTCVTTSRTPIVISKGRRSKSCELLASIELVFNAIELMYKKLWTNAVFCCAQVMSSYALIISTKFKIALCSKKLFSYYCIQSVWEKKNAQG